MDKKKYKYIYGPVPSWRLGSSLGIDPLSEKEKICSFDCIYCQIGKTKHFTDQRKVFVPVASIIEELDDVSSLTIDYITFSGKGEPTLAENLGEMIRAIKKIRKEKIAILTNSSLLDREDVRADLSLADFVALKLDAPADGIFQAVNKPMETVKFENVLSGMRTFKSHYRGRLALQVMFVKENQQAAADINRIARDIEPDEVQINTPLRPCRVRPLSERQLADAEAHFKGLKTISVYRAEKKEVEPISDEDTLIRRGKV